MREKYESLSLATLKDLAKARGLKGISTLRKPELIERMLEEDEKEKASSGSAEAKNTDRKSPPERKAVPEKKTVSGNHVLLMIHQKERIIRNVQSIPTKIRRRQPSLTVARRQTAFWKYFRMVMDLSAVPIICRVRMTFMYLHPRSDVLT